MKLVWDLIPNENSGRNSEGSFIRIPDGRIMFAYGSMVGPTSSDSGACNIVAIYSSDEGESWTEPVIVAEAAFFGVKNIMSVSTLYQKDGKIGVYFLIKENDYTSTIGRALSEDGISFACERCELDAPKCYYVINNDRIERFSDGRIVAPAMASMLNGKKIDHFGIGMCLASDDDGKTFYATRPRLANSVLGEGMEGFQEPGLFEHADGTIRFWARTPEGYQYECFSRDGMNSFTPPQAAMAFQSPCSPLEMTKDPATGDLYVAYNPIAEYPEEVAPCNMKISWGRTPFVVRRSKDDGRTWGKLNIVEDDKERGYCYPAFFFTKDGSMLLAYCRGGESDKSVLARLGIMKIALDEIE